MYKLNPILYGVPEYTNRLPPLSTSTAVFLNFLVGATFRSASYVKLFNSKAIRGNVIANGCPAVGTLSLTNDAQTAYVNIPTSGNISTNDVVPAGTTYGQPAAITGATITVNANGTYSFTATTAGTYTYTVPVCAPGQTTNCPTSELVINVSYLPQVAINLVYPTLLQADSVHLKFTLTEGVGPYTVIVKNSLDNKIDSIRNLMNGDKVKLAPRKDDTRYTVLKLTDANDVSRVSKFTKDTAFLNVLRPQLLLTLKADIPSKLPDNSFKTKIIMKVKKMGIIE